MAGKVTGADIARLAHVSGSTVSRALDPRSSWRISAEKRKRILALCEEYGYSLSVRKNDPHPKTFKVGLLLGFMDADLKNISFMIRQLCDHLQASGYTLTLIRVDFSSSEMSRHVRRIIRSDIADIYIVGEYLLQTCKRHECKACAYKAGDKTEQQTERLEALGCFILDR